MSDQEWNRIDRRRRLLVTLGAGLAGAYVAPTMINVAEAHPHHGRRHGSYSRPSYSRPSGGHHGHHYRERRYYRDEHRRHHDYHHDDGVHFNILLHPSRW